MKNMKQESDSIDIFCKELKKKVRNFKLNKSQMKKINTKKLKIMMLIQIHNQCKVIKSKVKKIH